MPQPNIFLTPYVFKTEGHDHALSTLAVHSKNYVLIHGEWQETVITLASGLRGGPIYNTMCFLILNSSANAYFLA